MWGCGGLFLEHGTGTGTGFLSAMSHAGKQECLPHQCSSLVAPTFLSAKSCVGKQECSPHQCSSLVAPTFLSAKSLLSPPDSGDGLHVDRPLVTFKKPPPQSLTHSMEQLLSDLSDFVWGPPLLILLLGTHVFLTFRLGFIQRYIFTAIRLSFGRSNEGEGDVSQFGALTTALAATIGTGNIVGVATAVVSGGPGAVLWMWLTGVFGIATKYAEALLAVKFRVKTREGLMAGGPMYVLERGLGKRWLGITFAAFTAVSAFGIGNMVQANSISAMVEENQRLNTANSVASVVSTGSLSGVK